MDLLVADLVTALIMAFIGTVGWYLTEAALWVPWRDDPKRSLDERRRIKRRVVHGYVGVLLVATAVALAILDMVAR